MRLHITLDDALVGDLDCIVGARERSSFIARAVRRAIDEHERSEALEAALGSISDSGHDWDTDPAAWVRAQRTGQQTPRSEGDSLGLGQARVRHEALLSGWR